MKTIKDFVLLLNNPVLTEEEKQIFIKEIGKMKEQSAQEIEYQIMLNEQKRIEKEKEFEKDRELDNWYKNEYLQKQFDKIPVREMLASVNVFPDNK